MAIVSLADVKEQLRLLHDDDDALIEDQILAAVAHLETMLGYTIEEEFTIVPDDLKQAVRMLVGHWYEHREATGENIFEAPLGVADIVRERRSYAWE